MTYWKAGGGEPPWQPLLRPLWEQSTSNRMDLIYQSLLDPVNGGGQVNTSRGVVGVLIEIWQLNRTGRETKTVETRSELSIGHVSKVVHSHPEAFPASLVLSVVLQNELKVVCKNALSFPLLNMLQSRLQAVQAADVEK
ncbi:hypothetical protein TYRP_009808 [Tyrophagus putrescentiae]|nr:hypothetical protein TYRP_009808 [Tyrophagus putrescentiae]